MECLYVPDITPATTVVHVQGDEARHARALRLRVGDTVLLSNGVGIAARCTVSAVERDSYTISVTEVLPLYGELPYRLVLALGILDNKDRMEFAVEKAVELGVTDIIPLHTRYCQHDRVYRERLRSKALAAMKQAQRARLPLIHQPLSIAALVEQWASAATFVVADENGGTAWPEGDVCIVVGPEGGLSTEEKQMISAVPHCVSIQLAQRRLRAETAAVLACGTAALLKMR